MLVIDKMLVCNPFAVSVHIVIANSLVWPNLLSRRTFITCSISARTLELLLLQLYTEVLCDPWL